MSIKALRIVLPLAVLAAGAGMMVLMIRMREPAQETAPEVPLPLVQGRAYEAGDYRFRVMAQGTVAARTEIDLSVEVSGRVVEVSPAFVEGGFFEANEVLVRIDPRDYELAVTRARATLAEADVRLQREQAEAEVAEREWETLGAGKTPSALLLRKPQLAEARAAVESAQANLQRAELDLERCQLRAPFAGRVRGKGADLGQYLNPGQVVARIYAVDFAEVRLPLSLDEVAFVDLPVGYAGESVQTRGPEVILSAKIGGVIHQWEGRITRTVGEIDSRTRMVTAVARVDDPYARTGDWSRPPLAVGLFVDAVILGREVEDVYVVPRGALRGRDQIVVIDAERRLRFRDVEMLRLLEDRVVFRGGLEDGDRVSVLSLDVAKEGMEVRLVPPTERGALSLRGETRP